ncbi:MAG TPA: LytTR family DNA-binding domain-containing protein [Gemmatimonadales bacterium]|nr:LytTR family DNA-binding domain-containing protein [Gemmatimonadales bacterium]
MIDLPPSRFGLTVLAADERLPSLDRLRVLIADLPGVGRVLACTGGAEALEILRAARPDLAFLAARLQSSGGLEVVRALGAERMPPFVLSAESGDLAVQAFDLGAADYLVEPFDAARCRTAFERARRRLACRAEGRGGALPAPLERIAIRLSDRTVVVRVDELDWLEARDNYVRIHAGSRRYLARGKISAFEQRLDPHRFFRVHRGALVNLDRIVELRAAPRGEVVVLRTGLELPVGATRREELHRRLGQAV